MRARACPYVNTNTDSIKSACTRNGQVVKCERTHAHTCTHMHTHAHCDLLRRCTHNMLHSNTHTHEHTHARTNTRTHAHTPYTQTSIRSMRNSRFISRSHCRARTAADARTPLFLPHSPHPIPHTSPPVPPPASGSTRGLPDASAGASAYPPAVTGVCEKACRVEGVGRGEWWRGEWGRRSRQGGVHAKVSQLQKCQ